VRLFEEPDLEALKVIARQSHSDSRFYFDGGFPKERCEALFESWIERSCRGWAQAVFVAELEGAAAGYCTCHIEGDVGSIGLVALSAHAQGRSLGRHLVAAAVSYARQQGISELKVVTQGRNIRAQQLYQRCGFVTDSVMLWYHKWFPGARATTKFP
jgi:dTDP-4-amino-4,6-dideoxy-D-galactose acyltransferase